MLHSKSIILRFACITVGAFALACGGGYEEGEENTGHIMQPFSVSSCASATADATNSFGLYQTSPSSYDTCYKGYVVDLLDFSGNSYWNAGTYVTWAAAHATNQADCEDEWMRVILYDKSGSTYTHIDTIDANGSWFVGSCQLGIVITDYLEQGEDYRIAVTARPEHSSSAPVRAVHLQSHRIF